MLLKNETYNSTIGITKFLSVLLTNPGIKITWVLTRPLKKIILSDPNFSKTGEV